MRHSIFNYDGKESSREKEGRRYIFCNRCGYGTGQCHAFSGTVRKIRRRICACLCAVPSVCLSARSHCGDVRRRKVPRSFFGLREKAFAPSRLSCVGSSHKLGIHRRILRRGYARHRQFRARSRRVGRVFCAVCRALCGNLDGSFCLAVGRFVPSFAVGQAFTRLFYPCHIARRRGRFGKYDCKFQFLRACFGSSLDGRALSGYAFALACRRRNACLCRRYG